MLRLLLTLLLSLIALLQPSAVWSDDTLGLPGLVNVSCSNPAHSPVVLVHGTFANARRAYSSMAPVLKDQGLCLYALNYGRTGLPGVNGTADIQSSLAEVVSFAQSVLQKTGASKVSLIGHSQGGLLAFLAAKSPELAGRIDRIVAVAPSLNGTTLVPNNLSSMHCPACAQLASQSPFMATVRMEKLNPKGVNALVLATKNDLVVTPVESQFLNEPGVTNLYIQDRYPGVYATHSGLLHVPQAVGLIKDFLLDALPASTAMSGP